MLDHILPCAEKITRGKHLKVHKFGGSSVANATCIRQVCQLIRAESVGETEAFWIVVSAMSGVTDQLISVLKKSKVNDRSYLQDLEILAERHRSEAKKLLESQASDAYIQLIEKDFDDMRDILRSVVLGKDYSEATLELVSGYGEIWNARLLSQTLTQMGLAADFLDAREVLLVEGLNNGCKIFWQESEKKLLEWKKSHQKNPYKVVTGYIASRPDGVPTTLKRNGSDYSAAIFGRLLKADSVTIWTDVDGVLSADPRKVPDAVLLDEMTYNEAMELAFFGAKVLHPHTMSPLVDLAIPLIIRNTFNASCAGTTIIAKHQAKSLKRPVKGISIAENIALLNLEGPGMVGVSGISQRLFTALSGVQVSVILISQASSEHSICLAVKQDQIDLACQTVDQAFLPEIQSGLIKKSQKLDHCCILAVVGENMAYQPGVAGKLFTALGHAGVNVKAVAQGSSERNISVVIEKKDADRALQTVHGAFYLSAQTLSLALIGPGLIGSTLLQQFQHQSQYLKTHFGIDIRVRAIANSKKMLLDNRSIALDQWQSSFEKENNRCDLQALANHISSDSIPHSVIVDCSSSEKVAAHYEEWLKRGIHIVTPNKKANSASFDSYCSLRRAMEQSHSQYYYEATVGAGLPIISTLKELQLTGDKIIRIEGILSGTLSYLFNEFNGEKPFSQLVLEAKNKGYTEPDPRDDLSGMDVARKLIILAREMGLKMELRDIKVENLVPVKLMSSLDVNKFLDDLSLYDAEFKERYQQAKAQKCTLRYVGSVTAQGNAEVSLRAIPDHHPFSRISGSDNIISFTTERYRMQTLTIQGPGAGPQVTAAGVFADILRLMHGLSGSVSQPGES